MKRKCLTFTNGIEKMHAKANGLSHIMSLGQIRLGLVGLG
jgi:hypothetical protein